jgi:uncharacterized repeat protein (TIGR02543 family)
MLRKWRAVYRSVKATMALLVLTAGLIFGGPTAAHAAPVTQPVAGITSLADSSTLAGGANISAYSGNDEEPILIPAEEQGGPSSYAVTFDSQGGSAVAGSRYIMEGSVALPAGPTQPGFTFNGWFAAAAGGSPLTSPYSPPDGTGAITLFAQWTAVVVLPAPVNGTAEGFTFIADSSTPTAGATITGYTGDDQAIEIPATVTWEGITYAVTTISGTAFRLNNLTSVTIPDGVTTIGALAFSDNNLTSVMIPDSVTTIGSFAFAFNALTSVTIGNSVATIDFAAFRGNGSAWFLVPTSVTAVGVAQFCDVPANAVTVTFNSVGDSAASRAIACSSLAAPTPDTPTRTGFTFTGWSTSETRGTPFDFTSSVTADTTLFAQWTAVTAAPGPVTGDFGLFTFAADSSKPARGAVITGYTGPAGAVTIPAVVTWEDIDYAVTTIGEGAFLAKDLTSVAIPNSVTTIGGFAFAFNNLVSVVIPNRVTTIGDYAFTFAALTEVTIPDSVITIGDGAFVQNALKSVTIPDSVITIGVDAFAINQLTSLTIPDSVTTIGGTAFAFNALTSVTIGTGVTTIGLGAFARNSAPWFFVPASVTTVGALELCSKDDEDNGDGGEPGPAGPLEGELPIAPSDGSAVTVTFNSAGGSAVSRAIACSAQAVPAPLPPTRTGFTLAGWSEQETGGTPFDFTSTVTADTTLFAQWTAVAALPAAPVASGASDADELVVTGG